MSGDRDKRDEDSELESLLRGLVPSPLEESFAAALHRERERIASADGQDPTRIQWSRVIPLMLVCTVAAFGFALFRYGDRLSEARRAAPDPDLAEVGMPTRSDATELPGPAEPASRFVPVSSHGTILNTSSGGLVETDAGPRQRLNIEYQDAYHWHDPESGTNIRFFRPHREEVIVPLPAD